MKKWLEDNLSKIKEALSNTRRDIACYPSVESDLDIDISEDFYDDLQEKFIRADVGADLSGKIVSDLKRQIKLQRINRNKLQNKIKETIKKLISIPFFYLPPSTSHLSVFLIIGVNGSGKTTSIGKLAKRFKDQGNKVLIVAADTFRAAAGGQLDIWAKKADVEIFLPSEIKKPDAVIFSAIQKAKKENHNLILIDTAGRLHSQINLMNELKKIDSVVKKSIGALHPASYEYEKLIVLDATIGQNAVVQADLFSKAISLTGIILAKLDSSGKGGVVLNIMNKLSLPVKFIGTGEKINDLAEFNFDEYLEGLLE